jgi:hypothetical protein
MLWRLSLITHCRLVFVVCPGLLPCRDWLFRSEEANMCPERVRDQHVGDRPDIVNLGPGLTSRTV